MDVSFVIPAYNEEKNIAGCVEAVFAELKRTPVEAEIVVVNNASTDRTKVVASGIPGVRVVDEPHKGLAAARKAGFDHTTGALVANIDADVKVPPGWLAKALREFEHDPRLVALSGPYVYYDLSAWQNFVVKVWYFPGWLFDVVVQPLFGHASMLQGGNFVLRRDAWQKAGGFDASIVFYGEDADVARRIGKFGKVKWTWSFYMYTSGRRLKREGFIRSGINYGIGLFYTHLMGRTPTRSYTDVR